MHRAIAVFNPQKCGCSYDIRNVSAQAQYMLCQVRNPFGKSDFQ